jgi:hypothetical protein
MSDPNTSISRPSNKRTKGNGMATPTDSTAATLDSVSRSLDKLCDLVLSNDGDDPLFIYTTLQGYRALIDREIENLNEM